MLMKRNNITIEFDDNGFVSLASLTRAVKMHTRYYELPALADAEKAARGALADTADALLVTPHPVHMHPQLASYLCCGITEMRKDLTVLLVRANLHFQAHLDVYLAQNSNNHKRGSSPGADTGGRYTEAPPEVSTIFRNIFGGGSGF